MPSASREPWEDYVKRLSAGGRDTGPQELEAHATVLAYIPKLSGVERRQALLGLFSAFASAETFVPPPGVTPEATAAATAPDILAAFATTPDPAFGDTLWRALMTAEPGREVVLRVLRDLSSRSPARATWTPRAGVLRRLPQAPGPHVSPRSSPARGRTRPASRQRRAARRAARSSPSTNTSTRSSQKATSPVIARASGSGCS